MPAKKKEAPTLIDQLREAIRESGMGVRELGRAAGIEPSRISRFVRGERSIDVAAASAICQALGYMLTKIKTKKKDAGDPGSG